MKVLNKNDYQEIRTWIHRNARQLELSVWRTEALDMQWSRMAGTRNHLLTPRWWLRES